MLKSTNARAKDTVIAGIVTLTHLSKVVIVDDTTDSVSPKSTVIVKLEVPT